MAFLDVEKVVSNDKKSGVPRKGTSSCITLFLQALYADGVSFCHWHEGTDDLVTVLGHPNGWGTMIVCSAKLHLRY